MVFESGNNFICTRFNLELHLGGLVDTTLPLLLLGGGPAHQEPGLHCAILVGRRKAGKGAREG